jgi:hypothetical protein
VRGLCRTYCRDDYFPNAFDISKHLVVPETKDAVTMPQQPSITLGVAAVLGMLAAIDLDHEAFRPTGKINDVRADRLLAYKL